jgi:FlaA1/EpsC-like NDP-sugar epimerase
MKVFFSLVQKTTIYLQTLSKTVKLALGLPETGIRFMIKKIDKFEGWKKISLAELHDYTASLLALFAALSLAFGHFDFIKIHRSPFYVAMILVPVSQLVIFYFCGLYKGIWKFSSAPDLIRVIRGATFGVMGSYLLLFLTTRLEGIPRSSLVIDWLLLVVLLGGGRFSYRILKEMWVGEHSRKDATRVLIVGAGNSGEQLYRTILNNPSMKMKVVAFVDDNLSYANKWVHRAPIAGTIDQISEVCQKYQIQKVIVAIPNATPENLRRIVDSCQGSELAIKKLPKMSDYFSGKMDLTQLQNISLEDLIGRKTAILELAQISLMLEGKTVLVTGAGGSIGSELCLQIAQFKPAKLVAVEISEFNLYQLEQSLIKVLPATKFVGLIADIRDKQQMEKVFHTYSPQVLIHAAAYKHVPIMEKNPEQAIHNNIHGTRLVAELAVNHGLEKVVLVSTDKAVNPTNIMGATKRIAEMICQHYQAQTEKTKFVIVRFGNVIGSSGSVIPLFLKQIQGGGPVTVTHPEVNRFFMSIPEAAQLILQASVLGKGGEIFVLDMGSPVKIVDLARQLITLNGLEVGKDIEIVFTGLRPGEKLYEEVLFETEATLETSHPMIRVARARAVEEKFPLKLDLVLNSTPLDYLNQIQERVQTLVPEYRPQNPEVLSDFTERTLH